MDTMVTTSGLTKRYRGHAVVDGLDLRIPEGSVYGFLGPNGAGKSTTMKMLLGLVRPTSGTVHVMGTPMHRGTRRQLLARIGSLIEHPPGYPHLTGRENVDLQRRLLDLDEAAVADAVRTVRLQDQLDKRVRDYSLGMRQRLGIALALARRPSLMVLDEPTNGLDPAGIEEMRALLRALAERGTTVMVSSHLLDEIDRTATTLGIVARGRMLFQGTRAQLLDASAPDVEVATDDPARAGARLAATGARIERDGLVVVPGGDDRSTARMVAHLVADGVGVHGVRRRSQTLEDVFMDLTAGGAL